MPRSLRQSCRLGAAFSVCRERLGGIMKQKEIETHKIGLIGQAPSRRGDARKPLAGPNGQKIARLAGNEHIEWRRTKRLFGELTIFHTLPFQYSLSTVAPASKSQACGISGKLLQVLVAGSHAITLLLIAKLTSPPASRHLPL